MSYQVGRGGMLDGLDEALDRHVRRRRDDLHLAARRWRPASARTSTSTVKVSAVKEQELPELDDDFAQTASEFDTVAELQRRRPRRGSRRGKRLEQAAAARDAVLEKLLDLVDVPLPEAVVDRRAHRPPRADRAAARLSPA